MSDMAWSSISQFSAGVGILALAIGSAINLRRVSRLERELTRLREAVKAKEMLE